MKLDAATALCLVACTGLVPLGFAGCAEHRMQPMPTDAGGMSTSASEMSVPIDVDRLLDRPGDHRYYDGVLCCAKGEADSCCADYE